GEKTVIVVGETSFPALVFPRDEKLLSPRLKVSERFQRPAQVFWTVGIRTKLVLPVSLSNTSSVAPRLMWLESGSGGGTACTSPRISKRSPGTSTEVPLRSRNTAWPGSRH